MEERKEGVFHRHPAKKEGHRRSNITAGVRKRQRFRVASREVWGGQGVKRNSALFPSPRPERFPVVLLSSERHFGSPQLHKDWLCSPARRTRRPGERKCRLILDCSRAKRRVKSDHILCEPAKITRVVPDAGVALALKLLHSPLKERKQKDI